MGHSAFFSVITICGIPELGEHSAAGVTHVLSILGLKTPDPPEIAKWRAAPAAGLALAIEAAGHRLKRAGAPPHSVSLIYGWNES